MEPLFRAIVSSNTILRVGSDISRVNTLHLRTVGSNRAAEAVTWIQANEAVPSLPHHSSYPSRLFPVATSYVCSRTSSRVLASLFMSLKYYWAFREAHRRRRMEQILA